jgi:drug/metabolite transporter (DMT)-like permease
VGPSATAFYRLLLALPFLLSWQACLSPAVSGVPTESLGSEGPASYRAPQFTARDLWWLVAPGLFFAGDLALWHWSIRLTSVANATLFANFAPILVTIAARILFLERIRPLFVAGLLLASTGALFVVGTGAILQRGQVLGDMLGLATAFFYAGYLLSIKRARQQHSTLVVMIWSSLSACPVLGLVAWVSGETIVPESARGWLVVLALALIGQIAGQGLIAFAFRHLPASFSSVSLLVQPVVAAVLAWVFLSESIGAMQALGGCVVLMGIGIASYARNP